MTHAAALLSRRPHEPPPGLTPWEGVTLSLGRVHEICGGARRTLALMLAARAGAPVLWIAGAATGARLNPCGIQPLLPPQDLLHVAAPRIMDRLWAMEEALRSGALPVVVADLPEPPGLTPVRRLHLAAEAGAGNGLCRPLGLILTPGGGGAPGVETRWRLEPRHRPGTSAWRLDRLRARMLPPQSWRLEGATLSPWAEPDPSAPDPAVG
jgi:protein ImuA